ncbi:MAG: ion transporter [Planctomycetaceae bacterium]
MTFLKRLVDDINTPLGRAFDLSIQLLIFLSLIAYSIETLPDLSESTKVWLHRFEIFSVAVFLVEYALRIYAAPRKRDYIFSFFGIIDLIAILPFLFGTNVDLRSARTFRLLRLFRLLKMARYNAAIRRFHRALSIAKEEITLFLAATAILLYLAAVGIYHFENEAQPENFKSVFHSLWWAVTTLTTVGYGDIYPVTTGGRIFTFVILLVGLGVISVPTGLFASALAKARQLEDAADNE